MPESTEALYNASAENWQRKEPILLSDFTARPFLLDWCGDVEGQSVLDLGCGTGLIGSWFKDYARKLVGVDISPTMLDMATKKGCYHELRRGVSSEQVFFLS